MDEADHTTLPTHGTRADPDDDAPLGIRWLFPETGCSSAFVRTPTSFGRGSECTVTLQGPGVSRVHAEVYRQGPVWVLRDCGSTNGTHVDAQQIAHAPLRVGSVVRIGGHVGVVHKLTVDPEGDSLSELSPGFWGGEVLRHAVAPALAVATSTLPICIYGETGSGKERVARAIHHRSDRKGAFVGVNCAAFAESLVEAQLFGYTKGAFTGAVQADAGFLRGAHGGTLLLDEVANLSLPVQAKLLRALQEQEVVPLGSHQPVQVDLRVIAAAQKPLADYVAAGTFRQDLMMRLNGLSVRLPPLRERRLEIPALFSLFVRRAAQDRPVPAAEPKLIEALCAYAWPGNTRELELVAQRLVALSQGSGAMHRSDLPAELQPVHSTDVEGGSEPVSRSDYDLGRLARALNETEGNLTEAARRLGISRQRAYRLLDGCSVTEFRERHR
jgi:transcriptional regulator of acetoin/glycerol metabolism